MNLEGITSVFQAKSFEAAILVVFFAIALLIAGYNWFYLYHSLHVSSKHMGLDPSSHIGNLIKASIFLALLAAGLSGLFFIVGTI